MTKQLKRGISWAVIVFDVLMVLFFVGDAFSSGDFRLDFALAFLFFLNAYMTKDYIDYLSRDIKEEERQELRIHPYRNKVAYREQEQEESFDTEELMELLQKKKEEYTQRRQ